MRVICVTLALSASLSFSAAAISTEALQTAVSDVERSISIADATWQKSIKGSNTNLYLADTYNLSTGTSGGASDVWPYTAAIEAHCSILEALEAVREYAPDLYSEHHDRYIDRLNKLIDNLEYYQGTYKLSSYATSNKEWKPYAVPRASRRGAANVTGILNVYDDQMWIARELIRAWRLTGNESYLEEATYLTDYVLNGWDCWRDGNGNEYGGITWGPGYNSKHACSNGPIIQPLAWLSEIYADRDSAIEYYYRNESNTVVHETRQRSEFYLEFARKVYDWQRAKLLESRGVYYDMMGADNTITVSRGYRQHVDCGGATGNFYSYNTGTMIAGAAELYRLTADGSLLNDLSLSDMAAMSVFSSYNRTRGTYVFKTDDSAESGFNTWFNDVLMRAFVDASPYETTYSRRGLNAFQKGLDYAYENHLRDGLMPIKLFDGWGSDNVTKGFHQFAFASQFAMLAVWAVANDRLSANVEIGVETPAAADDTIYNLSGIRLGRYADVVGSLPRGLYIVGGKKMVLGIEN